MTRSVLMCSVMAIAVAGAAGGSQSTPTSGPVARVDDAGWRIEVGSARVIGPDQLIVGNTFDGHQAELLTERGTLVRVNLRSSRIETVSLTGVGPSDRPWGLARLADGTRWTLVDRWSLALLDANGRVTSRHPLARPHVALYGLSTALLYQSFESDPRLVGASVGPPGNLYRRRLAITGRAAANERPASLRLENLLACGTSLRPALPCWLPADGHLRMVGEDGSIDDVRPSVAPIRERLARPGLLARPVIRDASLDERGRVWVLWEASRPGGDDAASGVAGQALGWFASDARSLGAVTLGFTVRMILGTTAAACYLLTTDGFIARVVTT